MTRIETFAVMFLAAAPANANSFQYACSVEQTCDYIDFERRACKGETEARAFDFNVKNENGADDFDTTATISFNGQTITLKLNSIGHGSPPAILESDTVQPPQSQIEQVWSMGGLTFGGTDGAYLSLVQGYSDGRPDSAVLVLPHQTHQILYSATCSCVGDTPC